MKQDNRISISKPQELGGSIISSTVLYSRSRRRCSWVYLWWQYSY